MAGLYVFLAKCQILPLIFPYLIDFWPQNGRVDPLLKQYKEFFKCLAKMP